MPKPLMNARELRRAARDKARRDALNAVFALISPGISDAWGRTYNEHLAWLVTQITRTRTNRHTRTHART